MDDINILLNRVKDSGILHLNELNLIENEVEKIFFTIKESSSFLEAQKYFDALDNIQTALAIVVFRNHESVTDNLINFIHDFDRIDDLELRKILYEKIKNGKYNL